jgi:GTP pyrophosphokinase
MADDGYKELRSALAKSYETDGIALIDKAYLFAKQAHEGQKRLTGNDYISHPVATAFILFQMEMDISSLVAAILHDTVEDTKVTIEEVKSVFGKEVAELVDGVTKLGRIPLSTKEEEQAENVRKMLLAMSRDIRVIIIKLADRLHNMRTIEVMPPQKRRDKSLETLEIYAPIAHRLGIRAIKEELEDIAIQYLDPIGYKSINDLLLEQTKSQTEFLDYIKKIITERVKATVPDAKIVGRIKSVHGIYRKMFMQNRNFDEIYDIYAVRIIVEHEADCYNCLGIIHDMFRPIQGRFKDYISNPKPNLYQSLHTTVFGKGGIPFEVQIRTVEMHQTAEFGIAAHWKYKSGVVGKDKFNKAIAWVGEFLESQKDADDVVDIVRTIKSDLGPEEVFVFTPKGDIISLPLGATIIDFAYAIHSEVGNRMVGAKVDGRITPIDEKVNNGEIIEIMTTRQQGKGPSRDWLKIVTTGEARNKIRSWFKKEKREENIAMGKQEVEKEFRRNFIRLPDDELNQFLMRIAERQHCASIDDLFAAIGYGGISLSRLMPRIKDEYAKLIKTPVPAEFPVEQKIKKRKSSDAVIVEGIDNCRTKLSNCCNPLPGDDIIGFITRGHGVSVHKRDCKNVPRSILTSSEPERWVNVIWNEDAKEDFKATLLITCLDRVGMLADVFSHLAGNHVMIYDVNTHRTKDGRTSFMVTIPVNGLEHMKSVITKLEKINGVLSVERVTT